MITGHDMIADLFVYTVFLIIGFSVIFITFVTLGEFFFEAYCSRIEKEVDQRVAAEEEKKKSVRLNKKV